jgi:hypothetical protein
MDSTGHFSGPVLSALHRFCAAVRLTDQVALDAQPRFQVLRKEPKLMRTRCITAVLFGLSVGGLVLAQDVRFNFDQNADFSKYKTYRWAQHPDSKQIDQLTLRQLGAVMDAELAKKGLQKATGDSSDLVIVYQFATGQEKQLTSFSSDFGYGPGWRGGWYGGGMGSSMTTATTSTIHTGAVALDMYDTATKQLVWRGAVSKTLDPKAKPEKQQKNMQKAAEKLMKKYPPPKKG